MVNGTKVAHKMRKLQTSAGRKTLTVRRKPYYVAIERGVALGFRANIGPGSRPGC